MTQRNKTLIFSGGGTGGHIYPAISVADCLKKTDSHLNIIFVGTKEGLEAKIVPEAGYSIEFIEVKGLKRQLKVENITVATKFLKGFWQARKILKRYNPACVFVTGGYVSLPVAFAAKSFGIKIILHEQNAFPGLANRIISRFCDKVLISFEESKKYFKRSKDVILTGNPIRLEILNYNQSQAKREIGADSKTTVLIVGGSRGAENLNRAAIRLAKSFEGNKDVHFILSTGEKKFDDVKSYAEQLNAGTNISLYPYIKEMPKYLAAADVVISRGGAIAISEITALGKPSIIVPSPYVVNNHQEYNARALEKEGACFVVLESELEGDKLRILLEKLIYDKQLYTSMQRKSKNLGRPDATEKIARLLREYIK
ncbi:undecaprenyldiphospho-muramoylpentapeptide beta-N-acetylglucosaminyltransferase [Caldicellulosiruptor acetigenus]|uniref:undecaprenyldiphospho-muramoylpentapeptide beta-N-acetylglucosaminyltransferase n=1 Tax=Caldicellulosiruptor acetigenus TaxID=301953 RepID=UPI0004190E8A|nr:undecaprenyldiphospho-muramoylpentapeptide beta-N-acetylglucosaminyltransferase [Caldicellulosiruptor acetigenus]WAM35558.1 undecaprenyldiphospho-muramoylpentapeptide beta-N-acetylglucosaminyltransferase [Caldicellulosiruptor acetigenus]